MMAGRGGVKSSDLILEKSLGCESEVSLSSRPKGVRVKVGGRLYSSPIMALIKIHVLKEGGGSLYVRW